MRLRGSFNEGEKSMKRKAVIGITGDVFDAGGKCVIPEPGLSLLDDRSEVEYRIFNEYSPEVTPKQVAGCDFAVSLTPRWSSRTLAGNDRLLTVNRFGVGYDTVDVSALNESAVMLCITPDGVRRPLATVVLGFMLCLSLRIFAKDKLTREGRWEEKADYRGEGLTGKTLGVIGVGNIGREVFRLAKPLDMKFIGCDPYISPDSVKELGVKLVDLDTVLTESDYVSINCLLNKETHHLIGKRELGLMKRSAYLINTARGPIVDETALAEVLLNKRIRGAGIDVFEQEPTPPDNPLLQLENVIVAPHGLGHTDESFSGIWNTIIDQITQICRGEMPDGVVNPDVWNTPGFQSKLRRLI